ncbi:Nicotinate dehydrogenase subunit B [compost metagenome]
MQAIGGRPGLTSSTAVNARSPRNVIQMMMNGVPWQGAGSIHFMPLFSESLRDDQLADLAGYLRAAYSREPAWTEVAKMVSEIRMENNSR